MATLVATDLAGNTTTDTEYVLVPQDIGGGTPDAMQITLDPIPQGTLIEWNSVPGAAAYDIIRAELEMVSDSGAVIDLGPVVCIEDDSLDLDTAGQEDADTPTLGKVFLYLGASLDGVTRSFGVASDGKPRAPGPGVCPG